MKKAISLLILFAFCLSMCACNGENSATESAGNLESTQQSQNVQKEDPTTVTEEPADNFAEEAATAPTEESVSYPPEGEYTEIVLQDERYFLCKLEKSGFSESGTYYGIYDGESQCWALEYDEYDTNGEFQSHGDGMFSYQYYGYDRKIVFLSAELGATFWTYKIANYENVTFVDGRTMVLIWDHSDVQYKLVQMDIYGQLSSVSIPGFPSEDELYWLERVKAGEGFNDDIFAGCFTSSISGEEQYFVLIYYYEDGSCTLIDDQEYTSRIKGNITYTDNCVFLGLEGSDKKSYLARFDKDGNFIELKGPFGG